MNILKPVIALLLLLFLAAAGCHRVSENPQVELPIIDIQTDKDIQWDAKTPCAVRYVEGNAPFVMNAKV